MQPITIQLKHAKTTKGTQVYDMLVDGKPAGSVYLPKLILPAGDAPRELKMVISE